MSQSFPVPIFSLPMIDVSPLIAQTDAQNAKRCCDSLEAGLQRQYFKVIQNTYKANGASAILL